MTNRVLPARKSWVLRLVLLLCLALAGTTGTAQADDPDAMVQVTVTTQAGDPLSGKTVKLYSPGGAEVATGSTNASGLAVLTAVPASYKLSVTDPTNAHFTQWSGDKVSFADAQALAVAGASNPVAFKLWSRTVSGIVRTPDGQPFEGVHVSLQNGGDNTGADGRYAITLSGLNPGEYTMSFQEGGDDPDKIYEQVEIGPGHEPTGRETTKARRPVVTGKVTDLAGEPIEDALIEWYRPSDPSSYLGAAHSGPDGTYRLTTLPLGGIKLRFSADGRGTRYYGGTSFATGAIAATVTGTVTTGINGVLGPEAFIQGSLMNVPLDGSATVNVYDLSDLTTPVVTGSVNGTAAYSVGGLAPGTYKVRFAAYDRISEWYDDVSAFAGGAAGLATTISLAESETRTGIDATLAAGGSIAGTGWNSAGASFNYAQLEILQNGSDAVVATGFVNNGNVEVGGLDTGDYRVRMTENNNGGLVPELLPDVIHVTAGQTTQVALVFRRLLTCATGGVVNLTVPGEAGRVTVDEQVTLDGISWSSNPEIVGYQWLRDGTEIPGANKLAYTPVAADIDAVLAVRATGSKAGYNQASCTDEAGTVKRAMTISTPVTITGSSWAGNTLTASSDTWSVSPDARQYLWFKNGATTNVTSSTYPVAPGESGNLTVRVTATKAGYSQASSTSVFRKIATEVDGPETTPAPPAGTPLIGKTLTVPYVAWLHGADSQRYQWLRNGSPIAGATGSSYKVAVADYAKVLAVRITPVVEGYIPAPATSKPTAVVKTPVAITLKVTSPKKGTAHLVMTIKAVAGIVPAGCLYVAKVGGPAKCARLSRGRATYNFRKLKRVRTTFKASYSAPTVPRTEVRASVKVR